MTCPEQQISRDKVDLWLAGEEGMTANGQGVSFWGDENIKLTVAMDAKLCEYTKNQELVCTL